MDGPINRRSSERIVPSEIKQILINDQSYLLNDISREGIGILVDHKVVFFIGQRIPSIYLEKDKSALSLCGVVNHLSENQSGMVCGIRFDFRNNEEFDYVQEVNRSLI